MTWQPIEPQDEPFQIDGASTTTADGRKVFVGKGPAKNGGDPVYYIIVHYPAVGEHPAGKSVMAMTPDTFDAAIRLKKSMGDREWVAYAIWDLVVTMPEMKISEPPTQE